MNYSDGLSYSSGNIETIAAICKMTRYGGNPKTRDYSLSMDDRRLIKAEEKRARKNAKRTNNK